MIYWEPLGSTRKPAGNARKAPGILEPFQNTKMPPRIIAEPFGSSWKATRTHQKTIIMPATLVFQWFPMPFQWFPIPFHCFPVTFQLFQMAPWRPSGGFPVISSCPQRFLVAYQWLPVASSGSLWFPVGSGGFLVAYRGFGWFLVTSCPGLDCRAVLIN